MYGTVSFQRSFPVRPYNCIVPMLGMWRHREKKERDIHMEVGDKDRSEVTIGQAVWNQARHIKNRHCSFSRHDLLSRKLCIRLSRNTSPQNAT